MGVPLPASPSSHCEPTSDWSPVRVSMRQHDIHPAINSADTTLDIGAGELYTYVGNSGITVRGRRELLAKE